MAELVQADAQIIIDTQPKTIPQLIQTYSKNPKGHVSLKLTHIPSIFAFIIP